MNGKLGDPPFFCGLRAARGAAALLGPNPGMGGAAFQDSFLWGSKV